MDHLLEKNPNFIIKNHLFSEQNNQTSKSATIEMYAPSSYNDTVTGETLSSVSEKSETYSNEEGNNEYMVSKYIYHLPIIENNWK